MAFEGSEMFEAEEEMHIPDLHRDLQRKYRNVGGKVEQIWRAFTIKQREEAMREVVGGGHVLKTKDDPSLDGLKDATPDWNLEDITSTADFFLHRLKFRVEADLHRQIFEGVNRNPGDREVIRAAAQRRAHLQADQWAVFINLGKDYGRWIKANGAEGRRSAESMDERYGLILPAHEAELLILRQTTTLRFYNDLVEEILDLGSASRVKATTSKKLPNKTSTASALANLTIKPKSLKVSICEIIAQAIEQKAASEDYLELLRSEPLILNHAVNMAYSSRPELVPDERGRILPLLSDIYLSSASSKS